MRNEDPASPMMSPADREQVVAVQLGRLRRMQEALQVRDEYLVEVKRELRNADSTLRLHIETLREVPRLFDADSAEMVKAKAAALIWTLERATAAVEHILRLTNETAERLSRLPDPDPGPRRPPVPETD
jgi:signal transduction histidine kinase